MQAEIASVRLSSCRQSSSRESAAESAPESVGGGESEGGGVPRMGVARGISRAALAVASECSASAILATIPAEGGGRDAATSAGAAGLDLGELEARAKRKGDEARRAKALAEAARSAAEGARRRAEERVMQARRRRDLKRGHSTSGLIAVDEANESEDEEDVSSPPARGSGLFNRPAFASQSSEVGALVGIGPLPAYISPISAAPAPKAPAPDVARSALTWHRLSSPDYTPAAAPDLAQDQEESFV